MSIIVSDLLIEVSQHLVEKRVSTTLGTTITAGIRTVTPGSMTAVYVNAQLIVGIGGTQEIVTVSAIPSATQFTATFAFGHASTDAVVGASFPSGAPDHFLWTQSEMLAYVAEIQADFLLRVRPVYESSAVAGTNISIIANNRFYTQPAVAIRVERASINGFDLYETTQSDLDLQNANWPVDSGPPTHFFRDQIDTAKIGLYPLPPQAGVLEIWYSKRGPTTLLLTDTLIVPDIFRHAIKYGVLARALSKDGEARDPLKAQFAQKKYDFLVVMGVKFMEGVGIEMQRQAQQPSFSPMAVPAGAAA